MDRLLTGAMVGALGLSMCLGPPLLLGGAVVAFKAVMGGDAAAERADRGLACMAWHFSSRTDRLLAGRAMLENCADYFRSVTDADKARDIAAWRALVERSRRDWGASDG